MKHSNLKNTLITGILLIACLGCKSKPKVTEAPRIPTYAEELEDARESNKRHLGREVEKLILLSEAIPINYDTLCDLLIEYSAQVEVLPSDSSRSKTAMLRVLDNVSAKYKVSRIKTATVVYCYQFEMIKRAEIEDAAIDEYIESHPDNSDYHEEPYEIEYPN
jgi:hypothetical protein